MIPGVHRGQNDGLQIRGTTSASWCCRAVLRWNACHSDFQQATHVIINAESKLSHVQTFGVRWFFFYLVDSNTLPWSGLSAKRDLGEEYRKHIEKFLPLLRQRINGCQRSADWLEDWVNDDLEVTPLLEVSAFVGKKVWNVLFIFVLRQKWGHMTPDPSSIIHL